MAAQARPMGKDRALTTDRDRLGTAGTGGARRQIPDRDVGQVSRRIVFALLQVIPLLQVIRGLGSVHRRRVANGTPATDDETAAANCQQQ